MKKNAFFTFIFSFIPGAGQMYQEYMKRGLSLMILAALFLIFAAMVGSPIFIIPILVIIAYSFFDTYRLRNLTDEKREQYVDDFIWNTLDLGLGITKITSKNSRKIIGYLLITIGFYVLADSVLFTIAMQLHIPWLTKLCSMLSRYTPTVVASIFTVFAGFKLVSPTQKED